MTYIYGDFEMNIFITSDQHWYHQKIIKYCNRPFKSVEEMNHEMTWRWNYTVSDEDIVIHLGDIALCFFDVLKRLYEHLNGTIIIIKGSHDRSKKQLAEAGFIVGSNPMYIGKYILTHVPLADSQIPKGMINIHGHIHKKETRGERINICVEHTNYYPVNIKNIMKYKQ